MSARVPRFPPDVAAALQAPAGDVRVRLTLPAGGLQPPAADRPLMETPYQRVLAALILGTRCDLRFVRTGDRDEGARAAVVDGGALRGVRHLDVRLAWDASGLRLEVRDADDPAAPVLAAGSP